MNTYEVGKSYVAFVKEGRREECLSTLFSPDAVSVEAVQLPGRERTVKGLDALRGKSSFFLANNDVHKAEIFGPYPHDDRFAVRFVFDLTFDVVSPGESAPHREVRRVDQATHAFAIPSTKRPRQLSCSACRAPSRLSFRPNRRNCCRTASAAGSPRADGRRASISSSCWPKPATTARHC